MSDPPRILALFGGTVLFGSERGNLEALASLKDKGADVMCLVSDKSWAAGVRNALSQAGFRLVQCPYVSLPRREFLPRNAVRFISDLMTSTFTFVKVLYSFRPTHIHVSNPAYVLSFLPGLAATRLPLVYRAGDAPTQHRWIWRLLWRITVLRTHRFVAVSRFIAHTLEASGVPTERINVIYSRPPRRSVAEPFTLPPDIDPARSFLFVYVGQITEEKGPHLLIEAFRQIIEDYPSARLLIAGRISDWEGDRWARALRARTEADGVLAAHVHFLGHVDDVDGLLMAGHVHVCPSIWEEPLANVVLEAKRAARPSIVFPSGGLPEMVTHGVDGHICAAPTAVALATALATYLRHPAELRRQGKAARASLHDLGTDDFAHAWQSVYDATGC